MRWAVAAGLGVVVTTAIFRVVLGVRIDPGLVDGLLRLFPLHQVPREPEERCALGPEGEQEAMRLEGRVGAWVGERFIALPDAEVRGERLAALDAWLAVEPDGFFRLVTALPAAGAPACTGDPPGGPRATPQLRIRAPGCSERRVPVVRPWVPRRIVLECARPGAARPPPGEPSAAVRLSHGDLSAADRPSHGVLSAAVRREPGPRATFAGPMVRGARRGRGATKRAAPGRGGGRIGGDRGHGISKTAVT